MCEESRWEGEKDPQKEQGRMGTPPGTHHFLNDGLWLGGLQLLLHLLFH